MNMYITDTTAPQLPPGTPGSVIPITAIDTANKYVFNTGGPFGAPGVVRASGGVVTPDNEVTTADLESEVFNTPMDALVDLWQTRYGNNWVDISEVMEDRFYGRAYKRLRSMGQLEVHYLTDRARFVCRKPE